MNCQSCAAPTGGNYCAYWRYVTRLCAFVGLQSHFQPGHSIPYRTAWMLVPARVKIQLSPLRSDASSLLLLGMVTYFSESAECRSMLP